MRILWIAFSALLLGGCQWAWIPPTVEIPAQKDVRVWVDFDPACGRELTSSDPDDCLAYLLLKRAGVTITGMSVTGGNTSEANAWDVAQSIVTTDPLYRGLGGCDSPAVTALKKASRDNPIRILALGPLTNIAKWIECDKEAGSRIDEIIFVGSRKAGQRFVPNSQWVFKPELIDLNVESDLSATDVVVRSGVSVAFVPFEAGNLVPITYSSLVASGIKLSEELDERLRDWSAMFSVFAGTDGFLPFDPVAVAYLLWPEEFECQPVESELALGQLVATPAEGSADDVYCLPKRPEYLRALILKTLAQPHPR